MTLQNPTLYVKIGDTTAPDTMPGAFYTQLCKDTDIDAAIRTAKAQIQQYDSGLDINRANIYVIAKAHCPTAAEVAVAAGRRIYALFAEDFAAFHITLVALLDESNESCETSEGGYNVRNELTYKFLASLTATTPFNRIFLVSNRNEYGRVVPLSVNKLLVHLPFLHIVPSQFESTVNMKAGQIGRVLFASAGLGTAGEEYRLAAEEATKNQALHNFADVLEREMQGASPAIARLLAQPTTTTRQSEDFQDTGLLRHLGSSPSEAPRNNEHIISSITAVASRHVSPLELNGVTVKEAESLLFGENAKKFYNTNYGQTTSQLPQSPPTLPLRHAVAEEAQLRQSVGEIKSEISHISHTQTELATQQIRLLDISKLSTGGAFATIDNAKTAIGRYYALQYKLDQLNTTLRQMEERHTELENFLEYMRHIANTIKTLPTAPPQIPPPEELLAEAAANAALNISLLRTDGLITETHTLGTPQNPYVLRVIGGFALEDLTRYNAMREFSR